MKTFTGKITWLGHAATLIESPRGARIAIDPFHKKNPKFPRGFDWGRLDVLAATHAHFDHFGDDAIELAKTSGGTVVAIFEMALHLASQGVEKVTGFNKGGSLTLGGVEFRMVAADHSAGASPGDRPATYAGEPCGYVMTFEDGFRAYHAGDTNVFSDMALIGELYAPDLALLPIGGFYTMGPREAARACELLRVGRVIPIHWGTFPALTGMPQELRQEIAARKLSTEVVELPPGGSWPK
ncbi:MAG TPA: metal-dependent hydrolase [Thermoanaerobaculia bacterium]|nr:metal-dependent hydrolase [Thermoanaerobaculia bacterium]